MGGRGLAETSSPIKLGESITQLEKYTSWNEGEKNIRKDFGLERATESQIQAIRQLFKGMLKYDVGHDENHTPYIIKELKIDSISSQSPEELAHNKELFGRTMEDKNLIVSITTEPNVDNSLIRMWDTKYRHAVLGTRGGFYTYDNNHKRKVIKPFNMHYGETSLTSDK